MSKNIHQHFDVSVSPRFGLKVGKQQTIKFVVENLLGTEFSNLNLEVQPSAEIEISSSNWEFKEGFLSEKKKIECIVTPKKATQIVINYKINGILGNPIYI